MATETARVCTAATTLDLGTGFIDVQRTTFAIGTVQTSDGSVGFLAVTHFDKRETAGSASITIRHYIHAINRSISLKHGTYGRVGNGKIQIAYENILHFHSFLSFNCAGKTRQIRTAKLWRDF